MRGRGIVAAMVVVVFVASARQAAAQGNGFVGAGGALANVSFAHTESRSPSVSNDDVGGRVGEWFVSGGGTVARHAVLEAELTMGGKFKKDIPAPRYPTPGNGTQVQSVTQRFRSVAFLGGYTTGSAKRVNLTALAGVMFVQTRRDIYQTYIPPTPTPYPIYPTDLTQFVYSIAPVFGADVPITVADRFVVVPQVRTYKIPNGGPLSVSVGAGARVKF